MSDRLPPADLEKLCRALGFEPVTPARPDMAVAAFGGARWRTGDWPAIWPPLDTDPSWAVKAMEAAGELGFYFEIEPPGYNHRADFAVTAANNSEEIYVGATNTRLPLALCRSLLEALGVGELKP